MIEDLVRKAAQEDDDAIDELTAIADREPARLVPHQQLLLHVHQPCSSRPPGRG